MMQARLYIFDMDGTLLLHSTGLIELAKVLGTEQELIELESLFHQKIISTTQFTLQIAELWGKIDNDIANRAFAAAHKISDIARCLEHIRSKGGKSCLITMSQDIFAKQFQVYGFDFIYSTIYPPNTTGVVKILSPADKPLISRQLCEQLNFCFQQSVAFGDSLSDEPLFAQLTETIAVNATPTLKRISKYHYDGDSLWQAYQLLDHVKSV